MARATSAGFEGIVQMLFEQKKLMDALEAENRGLRRQLADLRGGIGVAVFIEGKTMQLAREQGAPIPMNSQTQAALQSLQNLQKAESGLSSDSQTTVGKDYMHIGRPTSGQQPMNLNGEKWENDSTRSPLVDSFVL